MEVSVTEFTILHYLAKKPSWVFSREQILVALYGIDHAVILRAVDVQISVLRKKLGDECIETVRGKGYRFKE